MIISPVSADEAAYNGLTHRIKLTHADLAAGTTVTTVTLMTLAEGQFLAETCHKLITDFAGGGSALTVALGNASGTTAYGAAKELLGTEIDYWRTSIATPPTGAADQVGETEAVIATFTSTGSTGDAMTSGEMIIGLRVVDTTKI